MTWRLLLTALVLFAGTAHSATRPPDVTLNGTLTSADLETYLELPFDVPAGAARLTLEFDYDRSMGTLVDLGLRDPQRFRGWSGGNKNRLVIEEADATPSYLPGPLPRGTWHVVLSVPGIRKGGTARYTAKVWIDRGPSSFPGFTPGPVKAGVGWYRGDLHMHTGHSDGECLSRKRVMVPCPVFKTVQAASARGLDFISVTDHNGTTQNQALRELAPYFDDLLLIPGREMTTFKGHANVFGPTDFLDFQIGSRHAPTLATLLDEVKAANALISINHPGVTFGEECVDCGWRADVDFSRIDAIEVVNGGTVNVIGAPEGEWSSLPFWEARLNAGFRITGIGGSDNHNADDLPGDASAVGVPTTVVHARELSQDAILEAIRAGHVFVDIWGTRERLLEVEASANGARAEMGDVLHAGTGTAITVSVHVIGTTKGAILTLAGDGARLAKLADPSLSAGEARKTFELTADGAAHWLRVDVRGADGRLLLLGNPIYLRPAS